MKKIFALLLIFCMLCGCMPAEPDEPTTVPGTEAIQPSTEAHAEETQAYVEAEVNLAPVNKLSFCKTTESPNVAVLDERAVAFLTQEYINKDFTQKYTQIRLLDPYTDTLRGELLLDGKFTVLPYCGAAGHMALVNGDTDEILVLDKNLNTVLSFEARTREGVLSRDLSRYFYVWGSKLNCLEIATGENTLPDAGEELLLDEIWGYDPEENVLLVSAFEDTYTTNLCMAAIDLDDGSLALLYRDISSGRMTGTGVCLEKHYDEEFCSDVYYSDWTGAEMKILPGFLVNNMDFAGWHVPDSPYTLRFTYDSTKVDIVDCQLFRLGDTVEVCSLQAELKGAKVNSVHILPDGNLLVLAIGGRGYQSWLICPEQLDFDAAVLEITEGTDLVDNTILENYVKEPEFDLPEELAGVRATADRLQEEYGVTILLSNQCALAASYCDMPITTTDNAKLRDEEKAISEALKKLEDVLGMYPADFFTQFKNEAGERGMLILLVEDISEPGLNVIGVSYAMGQWYPVAVDITSGEVRSTYFHEFWHATENRINDLDKSALDLEAWENLNPAGFRYPGEAKPGYMSDTQYTYFYGNTDEEVYFVDPYGKTKPQEDRARLMEYIMATDWDAKMMMEHPVLKEKAKLLADAIREAFDTTSWEEVHWERFF